MAKALLEGELVIAVDFDGTMTTIPDIHGGVLELREDCKRVLNRLHEDGVKLVLWTCRTGSGLLEATDFLFQEGLLDVFDSINDQLEEVTKKFESPARKVGADLYVDDKNFGCNLDTLWTDLEEYVYGGLE